MSKTYIQLGRSGDIMTILPILWAAKEKCALMVAEEFAGLLDGVSYVEPVIYKGPHYEIGNAVAQAEAENRDWVCTQVNGPVGAVAEFVYKRAGQDCAKTTSFQKEMWKVAGKSADWDNGDPLLFDLRSAEREARLLKLLKPSKKYILAALDGISSPFPYKALVLELLKHSGYSVLDLATVRAEHIYDLLALYEQAYCLVACDSALLHLARATPNLPVLALTNDTPLLWNGSSWRPNFAWYCRYSDFPLRALEMLEVIKTAKKQNSLFNPNLSSPRIVKVWNSY